MRITSIRHIADDVVINNQNKTKKAGENKTRKKALYENSAFYADEQFEWIGRQI